MHYLFIYLLQCHTGGVFILKMLNVTKQYFDLFGKFTLFFPENCNAVAKHVLDAIKNAVM